MIKYDITNFKAFRKCIEKGHNILIEQIEDDFPIPEIYGVIFPVTENSKFIGVCIRDFNTEIDKDQFEKILIRGDVSPENCQIKYYGADMWYDIYDLFSKKEVSKDSSDDTCFNLVVLDDSIYRAYESGIFDIIRNIYDMK